jgi:hypothetical protein
MVGPSAVVLPALTALLDRGATPDLLCRGRRPGDQRCDSNGCDCDGETTHERSPSRWVAVVFLVFHQYKTPISCLYEFYRKGKKLNMQ